MRVIAIEEHFITPMYREKVGANEYRNFYLTSRSEQLGHDIVEEIDYVFRGVPHSLRFHWLLNEGRGPGTDMRYVYSPLQGLVHVEGNE